MHIKHLSDADKAWIKNLSRSEGGPGGPAMTEIDENRLAQLVKEHGLPCTMFSSDYGFAIAVYDHPTKSGEMPDCLATMTGYLAFPSRGTSEEEQCKYLAQLLTHNPENAEVLKYYRMAEQRENPTSHCY